TPRGIQDGVTCGALTRFCYPESFANLNIWPRNTFSSHFGDRKCWNQRGATNFLPLSLLPSLPIKMVPHFCGCAYCPRKEMPQNTIWTHQNYQIQNNLFLQGGT
ncbi:hypothetical protein NDU88_002034, partial [Pleurodeles waltl]